MNFQGHAVGCSPRNGNTCRIKESARIWTDLLESWFWLKYLSFSLNILRVWTVLKNFKCPPKQKSALFIPFCLCICILGVSFWEISDEAFLEHHFRAHVSWHETLCSQKVNAIDRLDTFPGGCFEIRDKKIGQFRFQTQQNSSNQVSNYSWSSKNQLSQKKCPTF